jgi:hypothetical protein
VLPPTILTPRSFQSIAMLRRPSPLSTRVAASSISSASAGSSSSPTMRHRRGAPSPRSYRTIL